jgi:CubicO group peptidase (beta-lactamase class C family)
MKRLLHGLWLVPLAAVAFLVFLWLQAGMDLRYLGRVLWYRDASSDDFRWKRSTSVAPAPAPASWRETRQCGAFAAAFVEGDVPALSPYLARGGALALVVIRDGALACEWYGNGGSRDAPAAAFSISKTVVSLLAARAVDGGALAGLDAPITRYLPELSARDARFASVTLASLLDMRSGIAFAEATTFPWIDQDAPAVYYATDLAHTVLVRPRIEAAPGDFVYNEYAPNLVGLALARATGAPLATGPMQALWNDLGAEHPAAWSVDDRGFAWHESGLVVTARDLARVGALMVSGGKVGGRQVAPAAFLARSLAAEGRRPAASVAGTALGYRNGWWTLGDDLLAMGRHGQLMLVSPATRTVIVRLGREGHGESNVSIARRLQRTAQRWAR